MPFFERCSTGVGGTWRCRCRACSRTAPPLRFLLKAHTGRDSKLGAPKYGVRGYENLLSSRDAEEMLRVLGAIDAQIRQDRKRGLDVASFGGQALTILDTLKVSRLFVVERVDSGYRMRRDPVNGAEIEPELPALACRRSDEAAINAQVSALAERLFSVVETAAATSA